MVLRNPPSISFSLLIFLHNAADNLERVWVVPTAVTASPQSLTCTFINLAISNRSQIWVHCDPASCCPRLCCFHVPGELMLFWHAQVTLTKIVTQTCYRRNRQQNDTSYKCKQRSNIFRMTLQGSYNTKRDPTTSSFTTSK